MLKYKNINYQVNDKQILNNVNVEFDLNKITAIIGANGSGKSTLIKLLTLNSSHYTGEIMYENKLLQTSNIKREIAILSQDNVIPKHLIVIEFLKLSLVAKYGIFSRLPKTWQTEVNNVLEICNCVEFIKQPVSSLSGGERQRVLIAAALIKNPKLLILDEPLSYLDVKYQAVILKLLKELNQIHKITIIIVIHDINQAIHLANELVLIKEGTITTKITSDKLNEQILENLYETKFTKHYNHFVLKL